LTRKQIIIAIGSGAPSGSKKQRKSNHEQTTALRQNRTYGQLRFLDPTADLALQFQGDSALESSDTDVDRA